MTTSGISQAGIESNLINQKMNEPNQQIQSRQDKEKDTPNCRNGYHQHNS